MDAAVVEILQAVLADSTAMLVLAENSEWDALLVKEQLRQEKIASLRELCGNQPLLPASDPWRSQAVDAMEQIISLDKKTQGLAEQWMDRLAQDLGELHKAKKVGQAYLGR